MNDAQTSFFVRAVLKVHQVLALVDVKYPSSDSSAEETKQHFADVCAALNEKAGLNYVPRESTIEGRVFEHASEASILIEHLSTLGNDEPESDVEISSGVEVTLVDDASEVEGLTIQREYLELANKANGKADLYFHAYVWTQYLDANKAALEGLNNDLFRKRFDGLTKTLSKVIQNVKKFPFTEENYNKYVEAFGSRKIQKK